MEKPTVAQVRSHAQKEYAKFKVAYPKENILAFYRWKIFGTLPERAKQAA
jgi:hypothetical protein